MKPNPEQKQSLDALARKNKQIRTHRADARARIEQQIEEEMVVLLVEQSQLANQCVDLGVSKTRVGRAMGTTNWETITTVLSLATPERTAEPEPAEEAGEETPVKQVVPEQPRLREYGFGDRTYLATTMTEAMAMNLEQLRRDEQEQKDKEEFLKSLWDAEGSDDDDEDDDE